MFWNTKLVQWICSGIPHAWGPNKSLCANGGKDSDPSADRQGNRTSGHPGFWGWELRCSLLCCMHTHTRMCLSVSDKFIQTQESRTAQSKYGWPLVTCGYWDLKWGGPKFTLRASIKYTSYCTRTSYQKSIKYPNYLLYCICEMILFWIYWVKRCH